MSDKKNVKTRDYCEGRSGSSSLICPQENSSDDQPETN